MLEPYSVYVVYEDSDVFKKYLIVTEDYIKIKGVEYINTTVIKKDTTYDYNFLKGFKPSRLIGDINTNPEYFL